MRMYYMFSVFLSLMLLACCDVEGQYYTTPGTEIVGQATPYQSLTVGQPMQYPSAGYQSTASQYSQYYTMGPALNTHVASPQPFNIEGNIPSTVYFGYQQQPVPFSQYVSSPNYATTESLWIKGTDSWAQYAQVPLGATVSLIAISPKGGSGYITDTHPTGQPYSLNYYFYPYSELTFYADTPGRHTLSFTIPGDPSNPVTIDVMGAYTPPRYYTPNYNYYPYWNYWGWGPWWGWWGSGRHEAGDHEGGGTQGGGGNQGGGGTQGGGGGTGGGAVLPGQVGEHGQSGEHGKAGEHGQGAARSQAARAK
jgi:uncharacterized membrane protein YgcG